MNLAQLMIDIDIRRPEHPAVIFGGRQASYSDPDPRIDALAWGLEVRFHFR